MAWERGYYYRVKKVHGRVIREYVGKGRIAELTAQLDELERERRAADAETARAERADLEALEDQIDVLTETTGLAARAALLAAGHHQHKRGNGGSAVAKNTKPVTTAPPSRADLLALTNRAQAGDKTVLPELRKLLESPKLVDALGGDLADQVQFRLIEKFSGKNLLFRETVTRKMDRIRADVAGPEPSPLERLLADRIASCWLHLHHLEIIYAGKDSISLELGMYYQKAIDRAHRRYLSAIRTLATVRKLALPTLQVNVARKQVNIAGPCVTEAK